MGFGVKVLLDACTLIWLTQEPEMLSDSGRKAIDDPAILLLVSHASVWEIALKIQSGKFTVVVQFSCISFWACI